MPRQPIPKKHRGKPMFMYSTLQDAELLPGLIGKVASASARVEVQFSLAMGSMLGVHNKASVAVFSTLQNARARKDALRAAALHSLDDEMRSPFQALMICYDRLDSARNEIVHGVWGKIDGISDAALWCSTQNFAVWHIEDYYRSEQGNLSYD